MDKIMHNDRIKGIVIGGQEIKAIQFADNLNMPLKFDQDSLDAVLDEFKLFQAQVGLKCNLDKSCIKRMGPIHESTLLLNSQGIPWTNQSIKILGIQITNPQTIEKDNIQPVIGKMSMTKFNSWKSRDLDLVGKVTVINALVMSLLVYKLAVLPLLSSYLITQINQMWSRFLWNGKRPKIAWSILTSPKLHGGLGLADLVKRDASLKIQWVQRAYQDSTIAVLADYLLKNSIGLLIWECNLQSKHISMLFPKCGFWFDVLKTWCEFNYNSMVNFDSVLDQIIWFNSKILVRNKPIFNLQMFCAGIVRVSDLVHEDYTFLSVLEFTSKFPGINYIEYMGIVQAFPIEWRRWFRARSGPDYGVDAYQPRFLLIEAHKSIVNISYRVLHRNMYLLESKRVKWQIIFDTPLWIPDIMKVVKKLWPH